MKQPRRKKRGLGVLQVITCLLVASAVLRLATEVGPAMANEGTDVSVEEANVPAADTGATDSLLSALQARERRMTEREAQLTARMEALRVAEEEIDQKLEQLVAAEARLSATIALADTAAESDLAQLTTVYENMKPREAADLFAQMPPRFAAGFLGLMRPDAAASIMTELDPEIAYSFSVVLAGRNADVPTE
ncbi:MotE family protein [Yoonia sp. R78084]|uniref:MotE family protein n=1 Tax=Yoonia sp. R78084 TaxID=3093869 RepID=UPI0037DCA82C